MPIPGDTIFWFFNGHSPKKRYKIRAYRLARVHSSREKVTMKSNRRHLTAIDLFSGCGGLTVGLERAGFRVVGAVENDSPSIATYEANHPGVELWKRDIRKVDPRELLSILKIKSGKLDLLAGCPPCQSFSTMRTLNGNLDVKDPRDDLISRFCFFVKVMRPKAVMLENVPGLGSNRRFYEFMEDMDKMGYVGDFQILDAADYGVPQRRRRLIYLGGRGFEVPFGNKSRTSKTVRDTIGNLPKAGSSGDPVHDLKENRTPKVTEMIRLIPKNGGSRLDLPRRFQLDCHKKCDGFKDVYGRMSWDDVAPTITGGCFNPSKGRFLHPVENRAITMREASLLQGFPRRYKFPETKNKATVSLMIGNALPPPFIAAHARSLRKALLAKRG